MVSVLVAFGILAVAVYERPRRVYPDAPVVIDHKAIVHARGHAERRVAAAREGVARQVGRRASRQHAQAYAQADFVAEIGPQFLFLPGIAISSRDSGGNHRRDYQNK